MVKNQRVSDWRSAFRFVLISRAKLAGTCFFFSAMDSVLIQSQRNFTTLCRTRSKMIYLFLISAELSYPRLRVLLHFDTQEFLNVLSMVSRFI